MLTKKQETFRLAFLHPLKQRFFYWRNLPMAFLAGVKLVVLDEEKAIATVPYKTRNKNPFNSMYFAVQSMAAELSTAAPAMLALKGLEADVALIITKVKADFAKKAQTEIAFSCSDFEMFRSALSTLKNPTDSVAVTAKTVGKNAQDEVVATFYFTWSFKRRT